MPKQQPAADEYGRFRVRDVDTGHERTIHAAELNHGNYAVLDGPASNVCGDPLPTKLAAPKSLSGSTNPGQQADSTKENGNA